MMTESSIDYVKKFADLAEQIAQNESARQDNTSVLKEEIPDWNPSQEMSSFCWSVSLELV